MPTSSTSMTDADIDWSAFVPADTTREFADAARAHFSTLDCAALVRRRLDGDTESRLWPQLAEQGYPAIGLPEELDGLGTLVDLCAVLEEAGRALLPAPLLTTAAAQQVLLAAGALRADDVGTAMSLATATPAGAFVAFDARETSRAVAVVSREGGTTVHVSEAAGVEFTDAVDASRTNGRMQLATATAIRTVEVAAPIDAVLASARICAAADLVGTAAEALDASVQHVHQREQFGRPIGSFQAVKHALADAYVLIERARSLTLGAAVEADTDRLGERARHLSLLAKAAASDAALRTTALRVQLLGAMGLTWESDAGLGIRRVRHTVPFLGTASDLYARVARDAATGEGR